MSVFILQNNMSIGDSGCMHGHENVPFVASSSTPQHLTPTQNDCCYGSCYDNYQDFHGRERQRMDGKKRWVGFDGVRYVVRFVSVFLNHSCRL